MAECGSCKRPILWALTPTGKRAPVDVDADRERGNVLVLQPKALRGEFLAVVLSGDALERARPAGGLRLNHWATCPDKAEWRARQDAKAKAEGS